MTEYRIARAYDGSLRASGWDLFIDDEWANRFRTKREAAEAREQLEAEDGDNIYAESLEIARHAPLGTPVIINGRTPAVLSARDGENVTVTYKSGDTTTVTAKVWAEMGLVK